MRVNITYAPGEDPKALMELIETLADEGVEFTINERQTYYPYYYPHYPYFNYQNTTRPIVTNVATTQAWSADNEIKYG